MLAYATTSAVVAATTLAPESLMVKGKYTRIGSGNTVVDKAIDKFTFLIFDYEGRKQFSV